MTLEQIHLLIHLQGKTMGEPITNYRARVSMQHIQQLITHNYVHFRGTNLFITTKAIIYLTQLMKWSRDTNPFDEPIKEKQKEITQLSGRVGREPQPAWNMILQQHKGVYSAFKRRFLHYIPIEYTFYKTPFLPKANILYNKETRTRMEYSIHKG